MNPVEPIDLESLCGLHVPDGRGEFVGDKRYEHQDDSPRVVVLRLDGDLYWFQEDPSDGWRSNLDFAQRCEPRDVPPGGLATFPPLTVSVRLKRSGSDHLLYGVNEKSGLVLFEIGTHNINDWYPSFVSRWSPDGYEPEWLAALDDRGA